MSYHAIRGSGAPDVQPVLLGSADAAHDAMRIADADHGAPLRWKAHPAGWWIADDDFPWRCWVVEPLAADDPWLLGLERAA